MRWLRLLGRIVLGVAGLFVSLVVALAVTISIGIPLSLDRVRGEFEAMASTALGREVSIEGKVELVPNWWPTLEVRGLRIGQPEDWPGGPESGVVGGGFARAERAFLRLAIFPLLRGDLRVLELSGEGFEVAMERLPDGSVNWLLNLPQPKEELVVEEVPAGIEEPLVLQLLGIDRISFHDVRLRYLAPGSQAWEYELAELTGIIAIDAPLELHMRGSLQDQPYAMDFAGDPLEALFTRNAAWPVKIRMEVGGAVLKLDGRVSSRLDEDESDAPETRDGDPSVIAQAGPFQFRALDLDVELEGDRFNQFDPIVGFRLPPFGPYRLAGTLTLRDGKYSISDLELSVGSSRLTGKLGWDHLGTQPRADITLRAPTIQLADFAGWELLLGDEDSPTADDAEASSEPLSLFSPEVLRTFDAKLRVDVGRVMSGRDKLGGMQLTASLASGRIRIDPFTLEVPGGSVGIRLGYSNTSKAVSLDLGMDLDHFDYGVLARFLDPETEMRGLITLDLDLTAKGASPEVLMHNASGQIDLALLPQQFEAGVIDLWSVNLIASVLPTLDTAPKSVIECLVAQLDVRDGLVTEHVLLVDTTRMRVLGKATIDLKEETIDLLFEPTSKRPEFFSLATPVRVDGTFDDFEAFVRPEDVIGTVIRFVTSVVIVPLQRLIGITTNLTDDEICQRAMERSVDPNR
ncbi:MAG: AsmA family protein [Deltaproteobacteria bacterium]|nr:AsmA family protein [Deltaproteobacteria bacterium]